MPSDFSQEPELKINGSFRVVVVVIVVGFFLLTQNKQHACAVALVLSGLGHRGLRLPAETCLL